VEIQPSSLRRSEELMAAPLQPWRLTPKDGDDEIIVSKKGLEELRRQAEQAEERAREIE
jgi:hypothetical protein